MIEHAVILKFSAQGFNAFPIIVQDLPSLCDVNPWVRVGSKCFMKLLDISPCTTLEAELKILGHAIFISKAVTHLETDPLSRCTG